ncbi:SPFH domain-containing protein [Tundrisphaera lichenicola]|uniref:SPFH domain-containing protein n=1 Tax=Tundrisphaera lichenicola TaxID=2029860 RepID=UPI003EB6A498
MSGFAPRNEGRPRPPRQFDLRILAAVSLIGIPILALLAYNACKVDVGTGKQAVLIRKVGLDLTRDQELAPARLDGRYYKGVQTEGPYEGVLTEGRYFYNPFYWDWEISDQFVIPGGKIGIRIALDGEDLPAGSNLAEPGQKGILRKVELPGRYPYNPYAVKFELHDPVTVPSGFRGVVTLVSGRKPKDPNNFLVGDGERGVQNKALEPGTYYLNPYETRVSLVDCRSKRFNLGEGSAMDFLSSDGFPVVLDGVVEFRVIPERASEVFVKYNEDDNGDVIDEEIISKIITPESRSLCRTGGSKLNGGQFISGIDREIFQRNLVQSLTENCKKQGVEILAVAITRVEPPQDIASPVRDREVAKQKLAQFNQERIQQLSEARLQIEILLAAQKQEIVGAEGKVIVQTTKAEQDNAVAVTLAEQKLKVTQTQLEAAKDKASAIVAKAQADADVIRFNNTAELAGLASRVAAFNGDGAAMAQNILMGKLAPGFRSIMTNSEGPLMELFGQFLKPGDRTVPSHSAGTATAGPVGSGELPSPPFASAEAKP